MNFRSLNFALCIVVGASSCTAARVLTHDTSLDPAKLEAGNYAIDPAHAAVIFNVNHFGFSDYYGRFNTIEGSLDFNPDRPESSNLVVRIDPASIDTGNNDLESQLISTIMFDVETYPEVSFVSTQIEQTGEATGRVMGDLTMHGVTKPVTLDVTFNGGAKNPLTQAETLGFSATTVIKRSEFGLGEWLPAVGNDVTLTISAEFAERETPAQ